MPRALIAGSGSGDRAQPGHQRHARPHHGHERRLDQERTGREHPLLRRSGCHHAGSRRAGGPPGARGGARGRPQDIDLVVFATMTPDYYFPGCGGLSAVPAGPPARCLASTSASSAAGSSTDSRWLTPRSGAASRERSCSSAPRCTAGSCPGEPGAGPRLGRRRQAPIPQEEWDINTAHAAPHGAVR